MITKAQLTLVLADQHKPVWNADYVRRYDHLAHTDSGNLIIIISGIRRCGKSTLLNEIRSLNREKDYYLNFDDDRLINFQVEDFQLLYELFIELFGKQNTFFFDEIQNIAGWERFVRRLHDEGNKVFITGSNAHMLSKELGTHLTGRYIQIELFPFTFNEYLVFNKVEVAQEIAFNTETISNYRRFFGDYSENGGIPEYLKTKNKDYLKSLYEGVVFRDIVSRHNLSKAKEIKELLYFIAGNVAKEATQNSLARTVGIKNSTTIKDYLSYFEDSYLVFALYRYYDSIIKQLLAPRKLYFIDNALARNVSFRSTNDSGRFLENIVFIELKRRGGELFYFKEKNECDFITKHDELIAALQVCSDLQNPDTKARELAGLIEAMQFFNLQSGIILTDYEEDEWEIESKTILVKPVWKWLIEGR